MNESRTPENVAGGSDLRREAGHLQIEPGSRHYPDCVQGRHNTSGVCVAYGVPSSRGIWGVLGYWACQSSLEGIIGGGQPSYWGGGELPQHNPWVPVGMGYMGRLLIIQDAPVDDVY